MFKNKKISILVFVLFFIITFFISFKSEAAQTVPLTGSSAIYGETVDILSYTAPVDNEVMIGDHMQVDFQIYYPTMTGVNISKGVNLYFYDKIDGVILHESEYLLAKTAIERKSFEGQKKGISTHDFTVDGNIAAKKYEWWLVETRSDNTTSVLLNKSFTFKTYTKDSGFYSIIKSKKNGGDYYFTVSSAYQTIELCQQDANNIIEKIDPLYKNVDSVLYAECKKYDSRPATPINLNAKNTDDGTYHLLAPIDGLTEITAADNIGTYFNKIYLIAIGLCAVLAVIMIVIGGIEYMGDESVFGKTEAKGRITKAILGLLIAIGAYALLNTIDPALLGKNGVNVAQVSAEITPLYDRGANDPKQANGESTRCTPVTSGPCSVANLTTIFGAENAVAMSKICNMESSGTNATSTTDICKPGNNAFSFGLFQVNLASNGILAGSDCVGLFDRSVKGSDAISPKYTSGFTCSLLSGKEALYNTCKARLLDPATNLAIAKKLFTSSKNAWTGDKKYCASAFQ